MKTTTPNEFLMCADIASDFDWSSTALGPMSTWPESLLITADLCWNSLFPMAIFYGENLLQIYNDPYAKLLRGRHPRALGDRAQTCWADVWHIIGPMVQEVVSTGRAAWYENMMLPIEDSGLTQKRYFTFSLSPISQTKIPSGVLCTIYETTSAFHLLQQAQNHFKAFRDLADHLNCVLYSHYTDGTIEWVNKHWYEYTKLPIDIATTEDGWAQIMPLEDWQFLRASIAEGFVHGRQYELEVRFKPLGTSDEEYRWHSVRAIPMHDQVGLIHRWAGSILDIHDRRIAEKNAEAERCARIEAERKLHIESMKREHELKALGESIPHILWTATPDGFIDWYNHQWMEYTGQSREEAAGWGWQAVHHPEDFPGVMQKWPESIKTCKPFQMEFRLRGSDGHYRWFLTRINPYKDESGQVLRWFGINVDIHEQKMSSMKNQRVAETIQRIFLPDKMPEHESVFFNAVYVPAESDALIGGDWYDAFELANGKILLSIGDVAGHGLNAAVLAGRLRQSIFSEALDNPNPSVILTKADRLLRAQSDTIVTALVAVFDPENGMLTYASAGHPAPILAIPGESARILSHGSPPLGTGFAGQDWRILTHDAIVPENSLLVLYTDGVTEFARDLQTAEARLLDACEKVASDRLPDSARSIYEAVVGDQIGIDDIAIVLVRRTSTRKIFEAPPDLEKLWCFHSSDARTAHEARTELMKFLRLHTHDVDGLFESEQIIGELLANAVEHAPGLVEIFVDWHQAYPTLKVRDSGPGFESLEKDLPSEMLSEDGRGLYIISKLSKEFTARYAAGYGAEIIVKLPIIRDENRANCALG